MKIYNLHMKRDFVVTVGEPAYVCSGVWAQIIICGAGSRVGFRRKRMSLFCIVGCMFVV